MEKYIVEIDYVVKGDVDRHVASTAGRFAQADYAAKASARSVGGALDSMNGKLSDVGSSFASMGSKAAEAFTGVVERVGAIALGLGAIGAAGALGLVAHGVTGLNSELEKTQIALADIFTSNKVTGGFAEGMTLASSMMQQIRKDAAALPGETADLAQIFKMASIPGLQAGIDMGSLEKLSANAMAFGMGVANLDSGTVARELSMLMSGRAGSHNVLGLQLAGLGGDKAEEFNKKSAKDRIAFLTDEFGKHAGSIDLFANSFDGLSSTMKDNAKLFLGKATSPLFENVKSSLRSINQWFDANQGVVDTWALRIGSKLSDAWLYGVGALQQWWPSIETAARNVGELVVGMWTKAKPIVESIGGTIRGFLSDSKSLDKLGHVLELYAAIKLGKMASDSGVFGLAGSMGKLAMSGAGAGGGGEILALGGGIEAVGASALIALPVLMTVAGAFDSLTNKSAVFHEESVKAWDELMANSSNAMENLRPAASSTWDALRGLADTMGMLGISSLALQFGALDTVIQGVYFTIDEFLKKIHLEREDITGKFVSLQEKANDKAKAFSKGQDIMGRPGSLQPKTGAGGGGGGVHIDKVEITVSGNQEPSRVARDVFAKLGERARFRTSSPYVRQYGTSRG